MKGNTLLYNETTGKKIIEKIKKADSWLEKLKGLMLESKEKFNYALVFELSQESKLKASIHMLFVFFPIDVVYLDKNKKAVDKVLSLKPFTLNYTPKKPAKYFIELPEGKAKEISPGDQLSWQE